MRTPGEREMAEVRRVEGSAENPDPAHRWSGANVPVALDQVLDGAQLAQADRSARVELLRRVSDLRLHAALEGTRRGSVAGDDRLRMAAAVARDVRDGLLERIHDTDRQRERQVLRRPVLLR